MLTKNFDGTRGTPGDPRHSGREWTSGASEAGAIAEPGDAICPAISVIQMKDNPLLCVTKTVLMVPRVLSLRVFVMTLPLAGVVGAAEPEPTDLAEFEQHVRPFLSTHCVRCHGKRKQKAEFALHDIDGLVTAGKDVEPWEKILEMVSLGDMPPEDEEQPSKVDRKRITTWIAAE